MTVAEKGEEAPKKNPEETSRRGRQVHHDGGGGKQQTDGRKRAGRGWIEGTGRRQGGQMTPGWCGAGWCDVEKGEKRGWGLGRWGRLRRRQTRADREGLGGVRNGT